MPGARIRTLVTGGTGFLGTNLVHALHGTVRDMLVIGRHPPQQDELPVPFKTADLLEKSSLDSVLQDFRPHEVIHLGAKTDFVTWEDPLGFRTNTEGTKNLIDSCKEWGVERLIVASSHVVLRPEQFGMEQQNYASSKLAMEEIVKQFASSLTWIIIRPCSIWGPHFRSPFREFFQSIAKGRYAHLGTLDPPKRLGFVGNTCYQIQKLLEAPASDVHGRTIYLADYETTTLRLWSRMIAQELKVPAPRSVPDAVVNVGARAGDVLQKLGYKNPPLTSFRLANMRTDTSSIPIDDIKQLVDPLPYTLGDGVKLTTQWLRSRGLVK